MALYSTSVKPVSRSSGRSATAAAAYRNAERITDERTGEIHDYRRRSGVDFVSSFAPKGMPLQGSAELWNKAEAAEVRKNARVAREVLVALPHELNQVQRFVLAQSIAQRLADRYGTAGTLAVHLPDREGDQRNHHAHILMTTRRLDASGQLGEKTRELDDVKRGPEEIEWIREMVEEQTNAKLEFAEVESRVDRRSLVKQANAAIDANDLGRAAKLCRAATVHEGPRVTQIRREAAKAGRAPLGALDRAAANDRQRQLVRDRVELGRVSAQVIGLEVARQVAERPREQEPPAAVGPVREAQPAAEKLTGSAAIRALMPEGARRDGPVPGIRERMAEVLAKLDAGLGPSAREAAVPEKAPPAAVRAAPEPAPLVKPVTKAPSAAQIELAALKASLRPVDEQVAESPDVIKAAREVERVLADHQRQRIIEKEALSRAATWRQEHPYQASWHDNGLKKSAVLVTAAQQIDNARFSLRHASTSERLVRDSLANEERKAEARIWETRRPVVARIEALESVVAREQAAEAPSLAPEPSQRRSAPAPRSERAYRPHVDRDEPERGMD